MISGKGTSGRGEGGGGGGGVQEEERWCETKVYRNKKPKNTEMNISTPVIELLPVLL